MRAFTHKQGNVVHSNLKPFNGNDSFDEDGNIKRSGGGPSKEWVAEVSQEVDKAKPDVDELKKEVDKEKADIDAESKEVKEEMTKNVKDAKAASKVV
jgi:hypothetical protein